MNENILSRKFWAGCVTQGNMAPLMAKVKCPHERGPDLNESEAIVEVWAEVMYHFFCQEKEMEYAIESFPEKITDTVQVPVELGLRVE